MKRGDAEQKSPFVARSQGNLIHLYPKFNLNKTVYGGEGLEFLRKTRKGRNLPTLYLESGRLENLLRKGGKFSSKKSKHGLVWTSLGSAEKGYTCAETKPGRGHCCPFL